MAAGIALGTSAGRRACEITAGPVGPIPFQAAATPGTEDDGRRHRASAASEDGNVGRQIRRVSSRMAVLKGRRGGKDQQSPEGIPVSNAGVLSVPNYRHGIGPRSGGCQSRGTTVPEAPLASRSPTSAAPARKRPNRWKRTFRAEVGRSSPPKSRSNRRLDSASADSGPDPEKLDYLSFPTPSFSSVSFLTAHRPGHQATGGAFRERRTLDATPAAVGPGRVFAVQTEGNRQARRTGCAPLLMLNNGGPRRIFGALARDLGRTGAGRTTARDRLTSASAGHEQPGRESGPPGIPRGRAGTVYTRGGEPSNCSPTTRVQRQLRSNHGAREVTVFRTLMHGGGGGATLGFRGPVDAGVCADRLASCRSNPQHALPFSYYRDRTCRPRLITGCCRGSSPVPRYQGASCSNAGLAFRGTGNFWGPLESGRTWRTPAPGCPMMAGDGRRSRTDDDLRKRRMGAGRGLTSAEDP